MFNRATCARCYADVYCKAAVKEAVMPIQKEMAIKSPTQIHAPQASTTTKQRTNSNWPC